MEQKILMLLSKRAFRCATSLRLYEPHLITAALVSLRNGLGMMGEIQRRLEGQAEQPS